MKENNPALFYLYAHGENGERSLKELDTQIFHALVKRSEVVFMELVQDDLDQTEALEADLNDAISWGEIPSSLHEYFAIFQSEDIELIVETLQGTGKKLVLERSLSAPFDYDREWSEADLVFYTSSLEAAIEAKEKFLKKNVPYQVKREQEVARQITAIPETTLAIFGAGHTELVKRVAQTRPTETHHPYPDYFLLFEDQLNLAYRQRGKIDDELFLRAQAEGMVYKNLNSKFDENISPREIDLLAHQYAGLLSPTQIIRLKDYTVSCKRLAMIRHADIFDSYLKKEGLPSVEEAHDNLRKQQT